MAVTAADIRRHLDGLAKPPGSLGRLEDLAARLCGVQRTLTPRTRPRRLVVFAADHGVVAAGVTAWPPAVTAAVVRTAADGRAACNVLAAAAGAEVRVVDVGTLGTSLGDRPGYACRNVRAGSRNLHAEPALTVEEFLQAWAVGADEADAAADAGCAVVAAGEVGIGNTTPASCLTALLTGAPVAEVVGRGAGADDATLGRKRAVVVAAVGRERSRLADDPVAVVAAVGGLEIAAIAGFFARAADRRLTVVLDGFVATAAALVADRLRPGVRDVLIAAHRSAEPGHAASLAALGLEPLLDGWNLRLGEGTGALLAMPLLDAAATMLGMATLAEVTA